MCTIKATVPKMCPDSISSIFPSRFVAMDGDKRRGIIGRSLRNLSPEEIERIKRRGSVVIRNVVEREQASGWKKELEEFVKVNPVDGRI